MASIIKQFNKQTGITYVYESESYWDKEKKQPRSKRRLIGKIDAETGEIIPTGGGRKAEPADMGKTARTVPELETLCREQAEELLKNGSEISSLKKQVMELTLSLNEYKRRLSKIEGLSKV